MGRPKKPKEEKRIRVNFTTLPKVLKHLHKKRVHMDLSEYLHRLCVADYIEDNPDVRIEVWTPEDDNDGN